MPAAVVLPRISLVNLLSCSNVTVSSTREDTNFPASYSMSPHLPFLRYHTNVATGTSTAQMNIVYDFGASHSVHLIAAFNLNFTTIRFQGNNTNSWGAPTFDTSNLTVARNPYTGRYQIVITTTSTGFELRYLRVVIPSQTPVAEDTTGTAASYFAVGGVWAGPSTDFPDHLRLPTTVRVIEPRRDISPDHNAWEQRTRLGRPRVLISSSRIRVISASNPGFNDALDSEMDLERQIRDRDIFLWNMNLGDNSQAWVVRRMSDLNVELNGSIAEGPLELAEAIR